LAPAVLAIDNLRFWYALPISMSSFMINKYNALDSISHTGALTSVLDHK